MTFEEFQEFITPLAIHFGQVKDEPTWRLYHAALMAPPTPGRVVLDVALLRASNRRFFPRTEELRADAEAERQALLKAHPFEPCDACRYSSGFVAVEVAGVTRMQRCHCFAAYRVALEQIGAGDQPLLVPSFDEQVPA